MLDLVYDLLIHMLSQEHLGCFLVRTQLAALGAREGARIFYDTQLLYLKHLRLELTLYLRCRVLAVLLEVDHFVFCLDVKDL